VTRGDPYEFTFGQNAAVKAWETGLMDMCVGERRRLTVPSDLAWGYYGNGAAVGPGQTVVFEVEVRPNPATLKPPLTWSTNACVCAALSLSLPCLCVCVGVARVSLSLSLSLSFSVLCVVCTH